MGLLFWYWVLQKTFIPICYRYQIQDYFLAGIYGRCITGLETGIKLVAGWYYLKYLPDW
jgi:hypothetical protein